MTDASDVPNLRHLRMVQAIGKLGGVSSAARELSTSQPTVTQAISKLEAEFGTQIFQRHPTGTFPTEVGALLLVRIDRFFEIVEAAVRHVTARMDASPGQPLPRVDRILTGTQIRALILIADPARARTVPGSACPSPASLIRSARSLERSLGRPLFDRSAKGPVPNADGLYLVRAFNRALSEIDLARGEISVALGGENLSISVGALPMAGAFELADAVRKFLVLCPQVNVRIVTGDYRSLMDDLANCRIDMIFGRLQRPDWATDVVEEALFRDALCIVARPGHPLTRQDNFGPATLLAYDWIVPAKGTPRRQRIEAIFADLPRHPRFSVETSSLSTSRALLLRSDMITVMTLSEVRLDASIGTMAVLPYNLPNTPRPRGVTLRADWLPTRSHAILLDCLRAVSAAAPDPASPEALCVALAS